MLQTCRTFGQRLVLHVCLSKFTACWHPQACLQPPLSTCSSRLTVSPLHTLLCSCCAFWQPHPLAPLYHSARSAWSHRLRRRYKSLALSPGCAWKQGQGAARGKKDMCSVWFQQLVSWVRVSCKSCTLSSSSNSLCAWCVQISSTRPSPEPHDFEKAIFMTAHSPKPALFL